MKLKDIIKKHWLRNILVPFILTIPILSIAIRAIPLSTDNLEMIRHFSQDEGSLVEFAGKTYSKGIIPLEYNVTYPQLYYYLAGIALFPYTLLKGIDYHIIVVVLRSFNMLICVSTVILLYFFCLRFFKSIFIAILSGLLLGTTPEFISWIMNSRTHLLEIFFLLISWYFCFRITEQYKPRYFIYMIIFLGLATATKFGGIFMIHIAWLSYIYSRRKEQLSEVIDYLKSKYSMVYLISSFFMLISILIPVGSILIYPKIQNKLFVFGIRSFEDFLRSRDFRIALLSMGMLFCAALFWFIVNRISNTYTNNASLAKKYPYIFIINKSLLFLFYIVSGTLIIFLICNPYYLLYPRTTIKEMGFEFAKAMIGTSYDPGIATPIFDKSGLDWLKLLFGNLLFNVWFGLLFIFYLISELLNLKKNLVYNKTFLLQRILLILYSASLLFILILLVKNKPHHYLLPIVMAMGILISFGISEIIKQASPKYFRKILTVILSLLLIFGFYHRGAMVRHVYEFYMNTPIDTGLAIGKWLENRFDKNTLIWKDSKSFYIPPKFTKVSYIEWHENINLDNIKTLNPDILIITNQLDADLKNTSKIDQAISSNKISYKLEKTFDYKGPLTLGGPHGGMFKKIFIYVKEKV